MKVDREIVARGAKPPAERHVRPKPGQSAAARRHDHVVEMWIPGDDRRRGRLHEIGDARIRKAIANAREWPAS